MYVAAVPNYSVILPLLHTCTIRHLNIKFPQSLGIATVAVLSERQLFSYRTLKSALRAKGRIRKATSKRYPKSDLIFWGSYTIRESIWDQTKYLLQEACAVCTSIRICKHYKMASDKH